MHHRKKIGARLMVLLVGLLIVLVPCTQRVMAKTVLTVGTFLEPLSWEQRHGDQMRAFSQAHPDIELDHVTIGHGEFGAKILVLAATGDVPDVLQIPPEQVAPIVNAGILENMDPWVAKDRTLDTRPWLAGAWDAVLFQGIRFGVPGYVVNYTYAYNKDILADRGIAYPGADDWVSWQSIRDIAKKATAVRGDGTVENWGYFHGTGYTEVIPLIFQAGGQVFDSRQRVALDAPTTYEAFDWLLEMTDLQLHGGSRADFYQGSVATMRMGSWEMEGVFQAQTPVGVASGIQHKTRSEVVYATPYAMSARSPNKEAAWRYMKFLTSKEGQDFITAIGRVPMRRDVKIPEQRRELLLGFMNSLQAARSYPYHVYSDYIQQSFNAATGAIWARTATPQAVIPELQRTLNAYFDQQEK